MNARHYNWLWFVKCKCFYNVSIIEWAIVVYLRRQSIFFAQEKYTHTQTGTCSARSMQAISFAIKVNVSLAIRVNYNNHLKQQQKKKKHMQRGLHLIYMAVVVLFSFFHLCMCNRHTTFADDSTDFLFFNVNAFVYIVCACVKQSNDSSRPIDRTACRKMKFVWVWLEYAADNQWISI